MAQADGYYPRINAAMVQSEQFNGMIVSLVGRIQSKNLADQTMIFTSCDGGTINMDVSQVEDAENLPDGVPVEAIGQVDQGTVALFITRELSGDTNMEMYNKMIQVQHNPKYASYFAPVTGDATMAGQ